MSRFATASRLPWEDRWTEPSVRQLLEPVPARHRHQLKAIIDELDAYEDLAQRVVWYGPGWNWTIQYQFSSAPVSACDVLCYVVPRLESPQVCVPLRSQEIEGLPMRRLSRIVREGIRSAKCAVTVNWAMFTPSSSSETEQLIDLIRRKHKATTTEPRAKVAVARAAR